MLDTDYFLINVVQWHRDFFCRIHSMALTARAADYVPFVMFHSISASDGMTIP